MALCDNNRRRNVSPICRVITKIFQMMELQTDITSLVYPKLMILVNLYITLRHYGCKDKKMILKSKNKELM